MRQVYVTEATFKQLTTKVELPKDFQFKDTLIWELSKGGEIRLDNPMIFSDVEIDEAKINLINSLDMSLDSSVSILNSYVYNYLDNLPLLEERKELFKKVTREDIINVSKKIKINTIYSLVGEQNEKDRN